MKCFKFRVGGGTRTLLVLTLAFIISLSTGLSVFAIDQGENISYTGTHFGKGNVPFVSATYDGVRYAGTCAELGVDLAASGTGTVGGKYTSTSKTAKMVYHLIYEEGYFSSPKCDTSLAELLPVTSSTGWTYADLVEAACQISAMGEAAWLAEWGGASSTAITVAEWYRNYDVSGITVPDNFAVYYVDAGSDQNFVIWALEPQTGLLKLKKISSNTGITG